MNRHMDRAPVVAAGLTMLWRLAGCEDNRVPLMPAVEVAKTALKRHRERSVLALPALALFRRLACDVNNHPALLRVVDTSITTMLQLRHIGSTTVACAGVGFLRLLSIDGDATRSADLMKTVDAVVSVMQRHSNHPAVVARGMALLHELSLSPASACKLRRKSVISVLGLAHPGLPVPVAARPPSAMSDRLRYSLYPRSESALNM